MKNLIFAVGLALAASVPLQAQQISGNELHEACNAADSYGQGFCDGYIISQFEGQILGAYFSIQWINADASNEEKQAMLDFILRRCVPESVVKMQIVDVVTDYLDNAPEIRHQQARSIIIRALSEAFPCGD